MDPHPQQFLKVLHQTGVIQQAAIRFPLNQEIEIAVQLIHPSKPGKVTVAGHAADEVPPKTLKSIPKQAGLP